jgi:hypothetical protein
LGTLRSGSAGWAHRTETITEYIPHVGNKAREVALLWSRLESVRRFDSSMQVPPGISRFDYGRSDIESDNEGSKEQWMSRCRH